MKSTVTIHVLCVYLTLAAGYEADQISLESERQEKRGQLDLSQLGPQLFGDLWNFGNLLEQIQTKNVENKVPAPYTAEKQAEKKAPYEGKQQYTYDKKTPDAAAYYLTQNYEVPYEVSPRPYEVSPRPYEVSPRPYEVSPKPYEVSPRPYEVAVPKSYTVERKVASTRSPTQQVKVTPKAKLPLPESFSVEKKAPLLKQFKLPKSYQKHIPVTEKPTSYEKQYHVEVPKAAPTPSPADLERHLRLPAFYNDEATQYQVHHIPAHQYVPVSQYPVHLPAPQYPVQVPPPHYPAPQYQTTQYPAAQYPQSQYPAPQYQTTQYPAAQYPQSQYPAPQYQTTQYSATQYPQSQYPAPQYTAPQHFQPIYVQLIPAQHQGTFYAIPVQFQEQHQEVDIRQAHVQELHPVTEAEAREQPKSQIK